MNNDGNLTSKAAIESHMRDRNMGKKLPTKRVNIQLPVCPRCKKPIVKTEAGDFCPSCGYRKIFGRR